MLPYFFFLFILSRFICSRIFLSGVFLRYIYILVMKMNIKVVIIHMFIAKIKICQKDMSTPYYLIRTHTAYFSRSASLIRSCTSLAIIFRWETVQHGGVPVHRPTGGEGARHGLLQGVHGGIQIFRPGGAGLHLLGRGKARANSHG